MRNNHSRGLQPRTHCPGRPSHRGHTAGIVATTGSANENVSVRLSGSVRARIRDTYHRPQSAFHPPRCPHLRSRELELRPPRHSLIYRGVRALFGIIRA